MNTLVDPTNNTIYVLPEIRPALCLDLDGTIRHSKSGEFISGPDDIALFPDVEAKIWEYRSEGFLIFGVTNQGGVAYGHKTPAQNDAEIDATCALFEKNPFHIIKCCLHMEGGKTPIYNQRSLLRKPSIGMLALCEVEAWAAGFMVDWNNSTMVGDREEDQDLAVNAGIAFRWAWEFFGRERPAGTPSMVRIPGDYRAKTVIDLITPKQIWAIRGIGRDHSIDVDAEATTLFGAQLEELSKRGGSALIEHLKRKVGATAGMPI